VTRDAVSCAGQMLGDGTLLEVAVKCHETVLHSFTDPPGPPGVHYLRLRLPIGLTLLEAPRSGTRRTLGGKKQKLVCYTTFDRCFRTVLDQIAFEASKVASLVRLS
jgi:hypothetical protein